MNEKESSQIKLDRLLHSMNCQSTNTFGKHLANIIKLIIFKDEKEETNKLMRLSNINKKSIKKIRQKLEEQIEDTNEFVSQANTSNKENNLKINSKIKSK